MFKRILILGLPAVLTVLLICLGVTALLPRPQPDPHVVKALPDAPLIRLYFTESASYAKPVQGMEFSVRDGQPEASFDLAGSIDPHVIPVAQAWADQLRELIRVYELMAWDGFHGNDPYLLDGTHFSIGFAFADGTAVTASGYGDFPPDYQSAAADIEHHFMQLLPQELTQW